MTLTDLHCHQRAIITSITPDEPVLERALRDMGFCEDDEVEILHKGPFGGRPLCVRLNQTLIALRLNEAAAIQVLPVIPVTHGEGA